MNLFSKEKDLIHRIANLILVVWLVSAVFIFYSSFINLMIKEPVLSYDEYELEYCQKVSEEKEDYCKNAYNNYKLTNQNNDLNSKKQLYHSLGNVIIVGVFLYLINKRK